MTETIGSPAHAGIDLHRTCEYCGLEWFPRTRGDRPVYGGIEKAVTAVPPHTRG